MGCGFVKIYGCYGKPDGYVSTKDIVHFDIRYCKGDYQGDEHYIVKAYEEVDEDEGGYTVSPNIDDEDQAYLFLDSIIEKLGK